MISASEEMGVINVYAGGSKHQIQDVSRLLDRANQALQTLERYKVRLDDAIANLTGVELEDVVTLRDVVAVVQRGEMVHRIADEIETMIIELGIDARLLRLQLDEIYGDVDDELDLVVADYLPPGRTAAETLAEMSRLDDDDVLDLRIAAGTLHREGDSTDLDQEVAPKGLRLLHRVHRLPAELAAARRRPLRRPGQAAAGHRRRPDGRRRRRRGDGHRDQGHPRAGDRVDDPRPVQLRAQVAAAPRSSPEKNSSAVFVLVCCSPPVSMPLDARNSRASVATSMPSPGRHFVDSRRCGNRRGTATSRPPVAG